MRRPEEEPELFGPGEIVKVVESWLARGWVDRGIAGYDFIGLVGGEILGREFKPRYDSACTLDSLKILRDGKWAWKVGLESLDAYVRRP
jgi:hypothetical protein